MFGCKGRARRAAEELLREKEEQKRKDALWAREARLMRRARGEDGNDIVSRRLAILAGPVLYERDTIVSALERVLDERDALRDQLAKVRDVAREL